MAEYANRQELANHIDDEGGIRHLLHQGTTAADLPPEDMGLVQAWQALDVAYALFRPAADAVMALLPEPNPDYVYLDDEEDAAARSPIETTLADALQTTGGHHDPSA